MRLEIGEDDIRERVSKSLLLFFLSVESEGENRN